MLAFNSLLSSTSLANLKLRFQSVAIRDFVVSAASVDLGDSASNNINHKRRHNV